MMDSSKKIQIFFSLLAITGLFLSFVTFTVDSKSESLSFMKLFSSEVNITGTFDGKIILGILITFFIVLIIRVKNDGFVLRLVSLLLIIASGFLFYTNIREVSLAVDLFSFVKYGMGYYMSLGGIIVSILIGLIDIFTKKEKDINYDSNQISEINSNNIIPNTSEMVSNNTQIENKLPEIQPTNSLANFYETKDNSASESNNIKSIKLSDIINKNSEKK